ncbi:MAG: glycoside hydrolase family 3 [bacterium]|nr:glycoside hydrolase family 3 [bacterium]
MKRKKRRKGKYNDTAMMTAAVVLAGIAAVLLLCWGAGTRGDGDPSPGMQDAENSSAAGLQGGEGSGDGAGNPGSGSSGSGAGEEGSGSGENGAGEENSGDGENGLGADGNGAGEEGSGSDRNGAGEENSGNSGNGADPERDAVEKLLAEMTLKEKVYQLFVVFPSAITGVSKVTQAGETTRLALEKYPVGGLIYDKSNIVSKEQLRTMLTNVQSYTKIPLILTCDEEGGRVSRLMNTVGTTKVGPMFDYREDGAAVAKQNAKTIAGDLTDLGFNMDLAPVADVWSNPQNTVIGDRAYSDDFQEAAELVAAAVAGFREGGAACTLKHFPGHGDTSADSHYGAVYVYKSLDEIREQELLPFQAGIDAGVDAVMMGHLIVSDVEEEPALFSYRLVTELLREEMHFEGVVITDSLQMKAMTDYYGNGEIAVKAVKAGVDMLLCPGDLEEAADALIRAVESGEITQERLDESVRRILRLKQERGILQ